VANDKTLNMLSSLLNKHRPDVVFLVEPMTSNADLHAKFFVKLRLQMVVFSPSNSKIAKLGGVNH